MPTDTQRAPTLAQCIEREREMEEHFRRRECDLSDVHGARAATDEAVRKVEALVGAVGDFLDCRDSGGYQAEGQAVDVLRAALVATITSAPTAQGASTGGASDE